MKNFRQLLGVALVGGMIFLLSHGVLHLEKTEEIRRQIQQVKQSFHQNSDVYAWIRVDGTKINYPVLQHPTDDRYYLTHDEKGNETNYGAIFTEKVNNRSFDDPATILYGHAMRDDSMFGSLDYFADISVFEEFQTVTIITKDKTYSYQIIAAYSFTDDHLYHTYGLSDSEQVATYVSHLETRSREYGGFYRSVPFDAAEDRLLILSTCDAANDGMRFVVHAIRKGES
ncbi:class B sortase [Streptococcus ruminantium]|uniref:class B sortase n=1 Tax=Streptococcus ruminantium TaxID=1917441 RepID=UPI0012DE289E|nr:class B sortase [Streptococcus ruminantium]